MADPYVFPIPRDALNNGLTLRDYFAAHAPEPPKSYWGLSVPNAEAHAAWSFEYADAMMKRTKP